MTQNDNLFNRAKKVTPGGVHSPVRSFAGLERDPVFFEKAEGAYLYDKSGKSYLDFCNSFGPMILGHRDPEVAEALDSIIHKAWSFGACEDYSLELAEWITNEIPWLDQIRFVSSGTEAVMTAVRLAKGHTGKNKILKFDGCYHGHVDSMLVKSGSGLAGQANSSSAGVSEAVANETLIAPLNNSDYVQKIFEENKNQIAAIIIEPLPANYGLLKQDKEFLHFLRKITKENDTLLIFDEVISGFRVNLGGMAQELDLTPDLVTYGKVIGGGFPVGAFGGKKEIMEHMAPLGGVYQAGTLSANPVCMVTGLATLKKIKRDNIIQTINDNCAHFARHLNNEFEKAGYNWQIIQSHSLFWMTEKNNSQIRSIDQISKKHKENFNKIYNAILNEGIYLAPAAYEVGFFSSAITEEEMMRASDVILNSIKKNA